MKTRVLEGFEISDDAIYAFGDFTAVVTFQQGEISDIFVGTTFGDFSDDALLSVLTTGQTLQDMHNWLAYITPDISSTVMRGSKTALAAVVEGGVDTYSGKDKAGKAWLIGFDGASFAFTERDGEQNPHVIPMEELIIINNLSIFSKQLSTNEFLVNGPTNEMTEWIKSKLKKY